LRARSLSIPNYLDIVVRADETGWWSVRNGDARDLSFHWGSRQEYFSSTPSFISYGVDFTHSDGTKLSADVVSLLQDDIGKIEIYNHETSNTQTIISENGILWIRAEDLNNDGYLNLLVNRYSENFPFYSLYIWDIYWNKFVEVEFINFDGLMFPTYSDGYIINHIRRLGTYPLTQILKWEGNKLIKISEESNYSD